MLAAHLRKLLILVLLLCSATSALTMEVPPLSGRINDYASMLSAQTATALEQKLATFERETSNQVVVLTVPTLQGETIEGLAIRVGDAWQIGQKDKGNGVILLLARQERKIRIEVGTGLQGVLPDITAAQIIRNVIAPRLKAGNYDAGINAGLDAIIAATKGEFKATATTRPAAKKTSSRYGILLVLLPLAAVIVFVAAASSRRSGAIAGGISLPLAVELSLGASYSTVLLLGILGGIAGFLISLLIRAGGGGSRGGGGWGGPTIFYGGGWDGHSSGGDSFSGGGGDFDGGGASDDW